MNISICKPDGAGMGSTWSSSESQGRTYRDVYIGGKLVGCLQRHDREWYMEIDGCKMARLIGGLRSMVKAVAQIEAHIKVYRCFKICGDLCVGDCVID